MAHTKDDDKKKQDHNAERKMKNIQKDNARERGERQYSKKTDHL